MNRRWPLPALLAWALAWVVFLLLRQAAAPAWTAATLATVAGALPALGASTRVRRLLMALGFPVSLWASGAAGAVPAWVWLLPLALLALAYPLRAWRDAPFFPTPATALDELTRLAPLRPDAAVLDAGCGLGHGLRALRRAYPQARLAGTEWSRPLAWATRLRCPWAQVARGDLWAQNWAPFALVYLFQRPETMPRAVVKASAELAPGAWLASLEFPALDLEPQAVARCPDGRRVWLYRQPFAHITPDRHTPAVGQELLGSRGHRATVRGHAADNRPQPPAAP